MKQDKRLFERLIRMLDLIPVSPRTLSAGQLHQKLKEDGFDVSKRTVERDLIQLSEGFGIYNDDSVSPQGWSWQKNSPRLSLPGLTPEEALTFKLAEAHLSGLIPANLLRNIEPYFSHADQILQNPLLYQPYAKWLNKVEVIHPWQPLLAPEIDADVLAAVQEATMLEQQLDVLYQSRGDQRAQARLLNPLGIVIRGYVSYLVCTIQPFTDVRLLAMHRIQAASVLTGKAEIPAGFNLKQYAESGVFGFANTGNISLQLRLKKSAGLHLLESPLAADQTVTETDSHLELTATVMDTMQLRWWILGLGANVEVVAPGHLRAAIQQELSSALQHYVS